MIERAVPVPGLGTVQVRFTSAADGSFAIDSEPQSLSRRRLELAPGPWTWLRQVHGTEVQVVSTPGEGAGSLADASVTSQPGAVLAIQTADCAPVVLVGRGAIGVAHAGWRGLVDGVVEATAAAVRAEGSSEDLPMALVGPCIAAVDYEFDGAELDSIVERFGESMRGTTAWGTPALDLRGGLRSVLESLRVEEVEMLAPSTSGPSFFSHRTRGDKGRQTTVAWIEPA